MKQYAISFGIGAALSGSFAKTFSSASKGVSNLNKEITELRHSQKLLANYNKDKKALQEKLKTIKKTKAGINELKKSMMEKKNQTEANKRALYLLEQKLSSLNKAYSKENDKLRKTSKLLQEKNVSLQNSSKSYQDLEKNIKAVEKATLKYDKANRISQKSTKLSSMGGSALKTGVAGLGLTYMPVKAAIKSESWFSDVKKQFNFENKEEEEKFKKELHKIITEQKIAISLEELYQSAATAGQTGIEKDEAAKYIELSSKIGMAFDMSRASASESMFQIKNALKLSYDELVTLADKINYLGNTTGASSPKLMEFVKRIASLGQISGFSSETVTALGSALIEKGMEVERAATGAKKIFTTLSKGAAATKTQQKAFQSLGLNAVQLSKDVQKDAEKTLNKLLTKISKKNEHEQLSLLSQLFGEEGLEAVGKLLNNREGLNLAFQKVKSPSVKGSMEHEADIKRATTENQLKILTGKLSIQGSKLGSLLLPEVNRGIDSISKLIDKVSEFQELHPEGFKTLLKILAQGSLALIGFGTGLKVISGGMKVYSGYLKLVGLGTKYSFGTKLISGGKRMKGLIGIFGKVSKAAKGFGVALLTNPITWYVAGILAIVAAGYLIYKNWGKLKEKAGELKAKVTELVDKYWFLGGAFGALIKGGMEIYRNWDKIKAKAVEMVTTIILKWDEFKVATSKTLGNVFEWIEGKWNSIKETGKSVLDFFLGIFEKIEKGYGKVKSFLSFSEENIKVVAPTSRKIPGYATGGIVSSPTLALIGEGRYAESIIPHDNSPRSLNLWKTTGNIIGAFKEEYPSSSRNTNLWDRVSNMIGSYGQQTENNNTYQLIFNPTIHSNNLPGIEEELNKSKAMAFDEFKKMIEQYNRESKRRGYGR